MAEEKIIVCDDGTIVVENPGRLFRLLQIKHMLSIEVNTGLTHSRGSVLKVAQREFGVKSRTKRGALKEVEALLDGAPKKEA
jgi:hypothetical protein